MNLNSTRASDEKALSIFNDVLARTKAREIHWDKTKVRRVIDDKRMEVIDRYTSDVDSYVFEVKHIPFSKSLYYLNNRDLSAICSGDRLESSIKAKSVVEDKYVPIKTETLSTKPKTKRKKNKKNKMFPWINDSNGNKNTPNTYEQDKERIHAALSQKPYYLKDKHVNTIREFKPIKYEDFLIRREIFKCAHKDHRLKDIQAVIKFANIDKNNSQEYERTFPAGYCPDCDLYFIMESTYQAILNEGIPICRITDEKSYLSGEYMNTSGLAKQSILMDYGYNVNQLNDIPSLKRERILSLLIEKGILTQNEIIGYLDFFINQRKSLPQYRIAISKWEEDREYICNLGSKKAPTVAVRSITKKGQK